MKKLKNFSLWLENNYEYIIGFLAGILVFRKPATIAIAMFIILSSTMFKNYKWKPHYIWPILIIAAPVVLDILFIWNNDFIFDGLKHLEKRISLLIFPLLFLTNSQQFDLRKILYTYATVFLSILVLLFIKFAVFDASLFLKWFDQQHPWELGYTFAKSMQLHAPALNMHVAFLVMVNIYLLVTSDFKHHVLKKILRIVSIFISIFFLLYLNTRIAVIIGLAGIVIILSWEWGKKLSFKQTLLATVISLLLVSGSVFAFAKAYPYMIHKYTTKTFANLDMVGRLDEFESPETTVYSSLVTRVSIWKTAIERAQQDLWLGVGAADGKGELNQAYEDTNQVFLATYKFPTHNQYIDFFLKFGILGFIGTILFMLHIFWLSIKLKNSLMFMFFVLFSISNLTDDFLIRFDGITFAALWISIFAHYYWQDHRNKDLITH